MNRSAAAVRLAWGLLAALGAAACLAAPAAAQGTASTGAVFGIVTSENGIPLDGADVILEGSGSAYTDTHGQFFFRSVPPGTYRLTVQKQGFTSGPIRAITVRAGVTEQVKVALGGFADRRSYVDRISVPLIRDGNSLLVRTDRKSTRLNSSHSRASRMPSSA